MKSNKIMSKIGKFFQGRYEFGVYDGKSVWIKKPSDRNIHGYLKAMNSKGKHIFIRPLDEAFFMLCDDLTSYQINTMHKSNGTYKPGRLIVESSPGNYQLWIHSRNKMTVETKCHWLKKMCSDPGAAPLSRWGRCPGYTNCKKKYQTDDGFPYANLIWCDYRHQVFVPPLDKISILPPSFDRREDLHEPSALGLVDQLQSMGGGCVPSNRINRADYEIGDESRTDFRFCLALIRRGATDEEIKQRLLTERTDWNTHRGDRRLNNYLTRTVRKARMICQ